MSFELCENVRFNGVDYRTDTCPLDSYIKNLGMRPFPKIWPNCSRGYAGAWSIEGGNLYLVDMRRGGKSVLDVLFPVRTEGIHAKWFSGLMHAWRGARRETGLPYQPFHDDEIVIVVEHGVVHREWVLDLRSVPDQTDDELRQTIPPFLWPSRRNSPGAVK